MTRMDDSTFKGIVGSMLNDATGQEMNAVSTDRVRAMRYYYGAPLGNERKGRSQVISTDVADTIGTLLPSIIKKFTSINDAVEFEATDPEGEQEAEQKTQLANYVFYRENNGFEILYDWIFDCLLFKNGYLAVYRDKEIQYKKEVYEGLSDEQFLALITSPNFEDVEVQDFSTNTTMELNEITGQQIEKVTHDISFRRKGLKEKTCIEVIPPEEFIISSNAVSLDSALLKGKRTKKTLSYLREIGIDVDSLTSLPDIADDITSNLEKQTRFLDSGVDLGGTFLTTEEATKEVWVTTFCANVDYDGDGIAELRYIMIVGDNVSNIVINEEIDSHPYIDITPIRIPHRHRGRSLADLVEDIQYMKSGVLRQAMDNMQLANNKRMLVDKNAGVDIAALLSSEIGGVVTASNIAGVVPLETPDLGASPYTMLEYLDSIKENRTGETRYNQGGDSNSLNKTATGINIITNMSQARRDLIAALIAEGLKKVFERIIELESKHGGGAKHIKLNNSWKKIDPSEWQYQSRVIANVGLGTGNKDQMLNHLNIIAQYQEKIAQYPALASMISPDNVFNTVADIVKNSGMPNPEKYFTPPSQNQAAPEQNGPTPEQQLRQEELALRRTELDDKAQIEGAKLTLDVHKAEQDYALKAKELELRYQQPQLNPLADSPEVLMRGAQVPIPPTNNGQEM